jgi:magnesium chelatase family protein
LPGAAERERAESILDIFFSWQNISCKRFDKGTFSDTVMPSKVYSAAVVGVDAFEIEIEVHAGWGPEGRVAVVGLPDTAVKESRDRVLSALSNSALRRPRGRITINLAPATVRKEGPSFDLPIALAMLQLNEQNRIPELDHCYVCGELALSGELRPVRGALAIALEARKRQRERLIVPHQNAAEAAVVDGLSVYGATSLSEVVQFLRGEKELAVVPTQPWTAHKIRDESDFSEVKGQYHVRRAVEVAAAGGHNLLMIGPPGSGKSMIAKRVPSILPPISLEEAIETTKIHSICGQLNGDRQFITTRPFRSPHHTISDAGLLGGSMHPTPGEVSLAHNGVLFLDELPEFHRSTLEVMRQPLEDGKVTISRAAGSLTFPAAFMLIAAMNPCPCGHYGNVKRECRCSPAQVQKYRGRISGPLLDRIDIHVDVPAIDIQDLTGTVESESSELVRNRVARARLVQRKRLRNENGVRCNARLPNRLIRKYCQLDSAGLDLIKQAASSLNLSARAYDRVLKVARTIADLAGSERINVDHLSEAVQYRALDRNLW